MSNEHAFDINETTYQWCVRAFSFLHDRLRINIKVHDNDGHIEAGQIFLFNHFARFETIIPQYLIHQATGAFCRCVASANLFEGNETFAKFLWNVGAVPTDHPGLLPFLAAEILRGRKVIFFPEGGMVKDRRVLDEEGRFSIFSQIDRIRRKHHKGAAAMALTLEIFKKRILSVHEAQGTERLQRWVDALGMDDIDALIAAARKPTLIVPANITFWPVRTDDNILRKAAELFGGGIPDRVKDELLIEGNILLKHTDMDIRFGHPIAPGIAWNWFERAVLKRVFEGIDSLPELFALKPDSGRWVERMVSKAMGRETARLRDRYMHEMYTRVTVNISHLASRLILKLLDAGLSEIDHDRFHRLLYLAIKNAQREPSIHLHRGLTNPEVYGGILRDATGGLEQFLHTTTRTGLIEVTRQRYRFLPKLLEEHAHHEVRLENLVTVYANEVAPVKAARRAVEQAVKSGPTMDGAAMARLRFDDEIRAFAWCQEKFSRPRHAEINNQETATKSGEPYLLMPKDANGTGVVLVHGFLASPAELREMGEKLEALGFAVIGVRLSGHGTSPWDLRDRSWEDWLGSVRHGYEIMSGLADRIFLAGFSTGGALALRFAAERPRNLIGVGATAVPIKFRNRNMAFVPIIHGVNKLARWVSSLEGLMPFRPNDSENPEVNYRHIPIRGLFELRRLVDELTKRLPDVTCPVRLIQGTEDQIVDARSAEIILDKLGCDDKRLHMIPSRRHGILADDTGGAQELVISFLTNLASQDTESASPPPTSPPKEAPKEARGALGDADVRTAV